MRRGRGPLLHLPVGLWREVVVHQLLLLLLPLLLLLVLLLVLQLVLVFGLVPVQLSAEQIWKLLASELKRLGQLEQLGKQQQLLLKRQEEEQEQEPEPEHVRKVEWEQQPGVLRRRMGPTLNWKGWELELESELELELELGLLALMQGKRSEQPEPVHLGSRTRPRVWGSWGRFLGPFGRS
mmetsp:Transcript_58798/g.124695  ORF Transcript_58798/g.124695 Transcript_58798/m.124695 type:complete len:181 (-) Transcript_58798:118-660(-)